VFSLPDRSDRAGIRRIRDKAIDFVIQHGASRGQVHSVRQKLSDNGYYVRMSK